MVVHFHRITYSPRKALYMNFGSYGKEVKARVSPTGKIDVFFFQGSHPTVGEQKELPTMVDA